MQNLIVTFTTTVFAVALLTFKPTFYQKYKVLLRAASFHISVHFFLHFKISLYKDNAILPYKIVTQDQSFNLHEK